MKPLKEQITATSPQKSIWLSASAGTGKTFVLVNRLIRLILEGNDPRRIVCITYTKAAATEMSERVIKYIGEVLLLSDFELKTKLDKDFETNIELKKLTHTRKKLISIIDNPQQLKVQTIHSFCESILKQFPLEANTPAFFEVIDDFKKTELVEESWKKLIFSDSPKNKAALDLLLSRFKPEQIKHTLQEMLANKTKLQKIIQLFGSVDEYFASLKELLAIKNENKIEIEEEIFAQNEPLFRKVAAILAEGGTNETKLGKKLESYLFSQNIEDLSEALLTEDKTSKELKTKKVFGKDMAKNHPVENEAIIEFQIELLEVISKVKDIDIFLNTKYFLHAYEDFSHIYTSQKSSRYVLEFDDLIEKTAQLLRKENPNREWVLYRLDGGIDHILIDEAQDTNESQWQIIDAITDEFFSGQGIEEKSDRSLFVVGDEKQSIYSFQGADVRVFADRQNHYEARSEEYNFETVRLNTSFRSGAAVINIVNRVVENEKILGALTRSGAIPKHEITEAMRSPENFGYFEINKLVDEAERTKPSREAISWSLPREYEQDEEERNIEILAGNVAQKINDILNRNFILPATGKRPQPQDIMVLIRKRKGVADILIKKLQELHIPVSGIDRLNLNESLAIKDLLALAKFAVLKSDDLNTACLLKSAFISFSEDELFEACWNRGQRSVYENLAAKEKFKTTTEKLNELAQKNDSVFEFFYKALEIHAQRRRFIGCFGQQINEILDEFLVNVKKFEDNIGGSLQHFIHWFEKNQITVKRNLEASGEVRIITAHSAKGLEAPIVIIPDSTSASANDARMAFSESLFLCPVISDYRNDLFRKIHKEKQELEKQEYYRLLYVALTRAKNELYIFGHKHNQLKADNWHNTVLPSVNDICAEDENKFYYTTPEYLAQKANTTETAAKTEYDLSIFTKKFTPTEEIEVISPSALYRTENSGKFSLARTDFTKGLAVHKLLEILPEIAETERQSAAEKILSNYFSESEKETAEKALGEAFATLNNKEFGFIFNSRSRAEVPVCGFYEGKFISGKIDRLIELGDEMLILDYKTNDISSSSLERVKKKYAAQMQTYKHLLEKIYTSKNIKAALLFTASGELVYV